MMIKEDYNTQNLFIQIFLILQLNYKDNSQESGY